MALKKIGGRQWPLVAQVDFDFADFDASGVLEAAIDIPGGAEIVDGNVAINTVFNSLTSDTLTVGDVGGTEDRYAAGVDGTVAGATRLSIDGARYNALGVVGIKWTGVGTVPTQGAGRLTVEYVMDGRSNEVQPV